MGDEYETSEIKHYFIHSKKCLSLMGVWPFQSPLSSKFFRSFWILQHFSIMVPEGIKIYENRRNLNLIIESFPPFSYNIVMVMKFINGFVNEHKVKTVLLKVSKDWKNFINPEERRILQHYGEEARFLNVGYICIIYIVLLSYMFLPLTPIILNFVNPLNESRPRTPLYIVELYIDQDKYFYTVLIHAYITSLAGILPLFGFDTLLSSCIHHASGLLEILGNRIKNSLKQNPLKEKFSDEYKEVTEWVIQHQKIIEFCEDINKVYSTSFLFVLSLCIIIMSATGVVTVFKLGHDHKDTIRFGMFTIGQIFHLFYYNFMGQYLLNKCEELNKNIYTSEWYKLRLKTKYLFKFMVMRSLKFSKIQAKIFPLTLENFTKAIKCSMSYFTVLKSSA